MHFDEMLKQKEMRINTFLFPFIKYFVAVKIIAAAKTCLIPFIETKYNPPVI